MNAALHVLHPVVWMVLTAAAVAAPGDFDTSWGVAGRLAVPEGTSIGTSLLQRDGGGVLVFYREVRRARADGTMDPGYGDGGRITASPPYFAMAGFKQPSDDRLHVIWTSEPVYLTGGLFQCSQRRWMRYTPSGQPDATAAGGAGVDLYADCRGQGMVVDSDGHAYWLARTGLSWTAWYYVSIMHADPAGNQLPNIDFVRQDESQPSMLTWEPRRLAIDARDRIVASAAREGAPGFAVIRYAGSARDAPFGTDGIAFAPMVRGVSQTGALPLPDGRILAYGTVEADGRRQPALVRFTESGEVDMSFGTGGLATVPLTRADESLGAPSITLAADGRIVVAADVASAGFHYTRLARLLADGMPDTRFGGEGVAAATYGRGVHSLAVRPTGEIVLGLASEVVQVRGGDLATPHPLRERLAVEYFHAGYRHYFITADEAEQVALESAPEAAWARTGKAFTVYDQSVLPFSPLVPMCRFWSDQSFAPKSSHFYTPYVDECEKVKHDPVWLFERNAFYVRMPAGAAGARTCPAGTQPLYRTYNNGMSGAPNHRYTTDPAVLDAMIAQGWIMEGEATTRVFACVPTQ